MSPFQGVVVKTGVVFEGSGGISPGTGPKSFRLSRGLSGGASQFPRELEGPQGSCGGEGYTAGLGSRLYHLPAVRPCMTLIS